jgi:hypothetical protein
MDAVPEMELRTNPFRPTFSPTDSIQSPCTAKLNSAKQRRFAKCVHADRVCIS